MDNYNSSDEIHAMRKKVQAEIEREEPEYCPEKKVDENKDNRRTSFTAAELMNMSFTEPRWVVPELIPTGITLLVGKSKIGKSWLVLNIAAAIAMGGKAISRIDVEEGRVLYLALEDNPRRLQNRLRTILGTSSWPDNLTIWTTCEKMNEGGLDRIKKFLKKYPDTRMIGIDTLERIRPRRRGGNSNVYAEDYKAIDRLKEIPNYSDIGILLVHHFRKSDAEDPYDMISGSTGLQAAVDANALLIRNRGQRDAVFKVTGRDVEDLEYTFNFDPVTCLWNIVDDAHLPSKSPERQEIINLLKERKQKMSPSEIAKALGKGEGNIRKLVRDIHNDGDIEQVGYGQYIYLPKN